MATELIATVHAATLHDALQKAERVAPTKGAAFDRAAGFRLEFSAGQLEIQATDLEVTFAHRMRADVREECSIRLSSGLLARFVASLPMASEQQVSFSRDDKKRIVTKLVKTGTKAAMGEIMGSFPEITWYDYDILKPVPDLGELLARVAWAADDNGVLRGIRLDGGRVSALRSRWMARTVSEDVGPAITAPLSDIAALIRMGTAVRMTTTDQKMILALDEQTQVTTTVILDPWPNLAEKLDAITQEGSFVINRQRFVDALERMKIFVRNDRLPVVRATLRPGAIAFWMIGGVTGEVEDNAVVTDQDGLEEGVLFFNPEWMARLLDSFESSSVRVEFTRNHGIPMRVTVPGVDEYETWMVRNNPQEAESDES